MELIKNENQRWLSTKEIINGWNENQHGERQLSKMIITKRKSSYSMWNECCPRRVWKSGVSNPSIARPRPFSPFPKVYTKLIKKHVPPTGEWGRGGWKSLETWDKFRIFPICINEHRFIPTLDTCNCEIPVKIVWIWFKSTC